MRVLTKGAISRHLAGISVAIGLGLVVQTLYVLVDLYFVATLGSRAVAAVAAVGSATFIVSAITQLISVGTVSLIASAIGRRNERETWFILEQALGMALITCVLIMVVGAFAGGAEVDLLTADRTTGAMGRTYLFAFLPGLAATVLNGTLVAGLRGMGIVRVPVGIEVATVLLNILLAPVLIVGWATGHPLGVLGAGLSTSLAAAAGTVGLFLCLVTSGLHSAVPLSLRGLVPNIGAWRRISRIGVPEAIESIVAFLISIVVYATIKRFGTEAQAGFGIGTRLVQSIFLPLLAIAYAALPIAGQNHGAGLHERVRTTLFQAIALSVIIAVGLTILCQMQAEGMARIFTLDAAVLKVAISYVNVVSWNFCAVALLTNGSSMLQALGRPKPQIIATASRLITFVLPVMLIIDRPNLMLRDIWLLSNVSVMIQTIISMTILWRILRQDVDDRSAAPLVVQG